MRGDEEIELRDGRAIDRTGPSWFAARRSLDLGVYFDREIPFNGLTGVFSIFQGVFGRSPDFNALHTPIVDRGLYGLCYLLLNCWYSRCSRLCSSVSNHVCRPTVMQRWARPTTRRSSQGLGPVSARCRSLGRCRLCQGLGGGHTRLDRAWERVKRGFCWLFW